MICLTGSIIDVINVITIIIVMTTMMMVIIISGVRLKASHPYHGVRKGSAPPRPPAPALELSRSPRFMLF